MSWFDWSPARKAEDCSSCKLVLDSGAWRVCGHCGHVVALDDRCCRPEGE